MCPQLDVTVSVVPANGQHISILVKLLAMTWFLIDPAFQCTRGKRGSTSLSTLHLSSPKERIFLVGSGSPSASLTSGRGLS